MKFIQYDLVDYYGSINKELFSKAVNWAKTLTNISEEEENVIFESKKSLLSDGADIWKKKGPVDFLIQVGAWDSAGSTDLVGLYLLNEMKHLEVDNGLYRDDGLIGSCKTNRQNEKLKNDLVRFFNGHWLKIEIEVNKKIVDFLDITLDLNSNLYLSLIHI